MRFGAWVELLNHIEENSYIDLQEMKGTFKSNEVYCSKEGELKEFGERPTQGKRTDLIEVKKLIDSGKRPMEIADEHPEHFATIIKYERGVDKYDKYKRQKKLQNDRTIPEVYIRYGDPGTGKTRWLDDTYGLDGWRVAPCNRGEWFDGCSERDVVCFDDVKINEIPPIGKTLKLTHEYPMQVPVKGGFDTWKPRVVVFTSNDHPSEWWKNVAPKSYRAFMRRVTKIEHLVYKPGQDTHGRQTSTQCRTEQTIQGETSPGREKEDDQDSYGTRCEEDCSLCNESNSGD
jgi:hypothetical protein